MDFLKSIFKSDLGKILAGLVVLAVIGAIVSWCRMDSAGRHAMLSSAGYIAAWIVIVLALPWVTYFMLAIVARSDPFMDSFDLVSAYTLLEIVLLAWLFDWRVDSPRQWTFFILGMLISAAYNLFTCVWIAEELE